MFLKLHFCATNLQMTWFFFLAPLLLLQRESFLWRRARLRDGDKRSDTLTVFREIYSVCFFKWDTFIVLAAAQTANRKGLHRRSVVASNMSVLKVWPRAALGFRLVPFVANEHLLCAALTPWLCLWRVCSSRGASRLQSVSAPVRTVPRMS